MSSTGPAAIEPVEDLAGAVANAAGGKGAPSEVPLTHLQESNRVFHRK
jgi:hypothetical protein